LTVGSTPLRRNPSGNSNIKCRGERHSPGVAKERVNTNVGARVPRPFFISEIGPRLTVSKGVTDIECRFSERVVRPANCQLPTATCGVLRGEGSSWLRPARRCAPPAGYGRGVVLEPLLQDTGHMVLAIRSARRQPRGPPPPPLLVVRCLEPLKSIATSDTEAGGAGSWKKFWIPACAGMTENRE
jgi:hypothetical protein